MTTIFLVDDIKDLREQLSAYFKKENPKFRIVEFGEGTEYDIKCIEDIIRRKKNGKIFDKDLAIVDLLFPIIDRDFWTKLNTDFRSKNPNANVFTQKKEEIHGYNLLLAIRHICGPSMKLVCLTAWSEEDIGHLITGDRPFEKDPNFMHLQRTHFNLRQVAADIINFYNN